MGLSAVGGGAGGDKERIARLKRIKQLKDSGGSYENLLNEVRSPKCHPSLLPNRMLNMS